MDIAQQLRSWTVDWNGAPMVDGEPPREGYGCKLLRDAAAEIERLRAALHEIGEMFYVSQTGAVLLKGDYGNYDVLEAANHALEQTASTK
jgi:hypothetical protein